MVGYKYVSTRGGCVVHFHGRLVLNMNTIGVGGIKMNPQ